MKKKYVRNEHGINIKMCCASCKLRKIESGEMDIDSLAENLKEAKQLVAFCKGKLQHVEDEVNKIMEGKE